MFPVERFGQIMRHCPMNRLDDYVRAVGEAMAEFDIDRTRERRCAFLARLATLTAECAWLGDDESLASAAGRFVAGAPMSRQDTAAAQNGRKRGSRTVGDTGDRYPARGPIGLQGKNAYRQFGQLLGIDLEAQPELAASPAQCFRIAALYWAHNGLNELADAGDHERIARYFEWVPGIDGDDPAQRQRERILALLTRFGSDPPAASAPQGRAAAEAPSPLRASTAAPGARKKARANGTRARAALAKAARPVSRTRVLPKAPNARATSDPPTPSDIEIRLSNGWVPTGRTTSGRTTAARSSTRTLATGRDATGPASPSRSARSHASRHGKATDADGAARGIGTNETDGTNGTNGTRGTNSTNNPPRRRRAGTTVAGDERQLNARRDTLDFRDQMFVPTLIEVPPRIPLGNYVQQRLPVLDQGQEGACTGYALAAVVHFLLGRRSIEPDRQQVSPRMLYEMARRYDEWPGENYDGSSARGAMKGWHKHGVCADDDWPSRPTKKEKVVGMSEARVAAARRRPLGAYFRVNHLDLVAMHSAIAEVGILYATASVHDGWNKVGRDGVIRREGSLLGGHAFAIVAYDEEGFWLQNSWGRDWGGRGFARISYDDWLENGTDVWVARLGAPVQLQSAAATAALQGGRAGASASYVHEDLRPHVISIGNEGELHPGGTWGTDRHDVERLFTEELPRITANWTRPRVVFYLHGGLVPEETALQRVSEYRSPLLAQQAYPIAMIWHSDFASTLGNILADAMRNRRSEGWIDKAKDFLLDRLDDMIEPLARGLLGKLAWSEMKENARMASLAGHAADSTLKLLKKFQAQHPDLEVHLVGHSAGSIFIAPMLDRFRQLDLKVKTCTLWAPACTHELFRQHYQPALEQGTLEKLAIYLLTEAAEQNDNCMQVYNKSLLYLVSHALEKRLRIPGDRDRPGEPLLGMAKYLDPSFPDSYDATLAGMMTKLGVDLVFSPNDQPPESLSASKAFHHGDFDNDTRTVMSTFGRILGAVPVPAQTPTPDPMSGEPVTMVTVTNPDMKGAGLDAVRLTLACSEAAAVNQRRAIDRLSRRG